MNAISRRIAAFFLPLLALVGCTANTSDNTTTFVINTVQAERDGTAIISALTAILAIPSVAALLGPDLPIVQAALVAAQAALDQFKTLINGAQTVAVSNHDVRQSITSFVNSAEAGLAKVEGIMPQLQGPLATTVGNYSAAAQSLISFVLLAMGRVGFSRKEPVMTEAQALAIARH